MTAPRHTRAFSVTELLAAMAMLVVIVGLLAMLLTRTRDLWSTTTHRERCIAEARATLDLIAADIEQSITDTNLHFVVSVTTQSLAGVEMPSSTIYCVRLDNRAGEFRPLTELDFRIEPQTNATGSGTGRYILARRANRLPLIEATATPPLGPDKILTQRATPLSSGVVGLVAGVSAAPTDPTRLLGSWDSRTDTPRLPHHQETLRKAVQLTGARRAEFTERKKLRFTRRVALDAATADTLYSTAITEQADDQQ